MPYFDERSLRRILRRIRVAAAVIAVVDTGYLIAVATGLAVFSRRRGVVAGMLFASQVVTAVVAAWILAHLEGRRAAVVGQAAERHAALLRHPSCGLRSVPRR